MVKFRLSFVVNAETIFDLASRILPIHDLDVVEIPTQAIQPPTQHFSKKRRRQRKRIDLQTGGNKAILDVLADGKPHRTKEAIESLRTVKLSVNGIHTRFKRLERYSIIKQPQPGWWQLKNTNIPVGIANGGSQ